MYEYVFNFHLRFVFTEEEEAGQVLNACIASVASGCRSLSEGTKLKTDNVFVMITSFSRLQHFDLRSPLGLRFVYTGQGGCERLISCLHQSLFEGTELQ